MVICLVFEYYKKREKNQPRTGHALAKGRMIQVPPGDKSVGQEMLWVRAAPAQGKESPAQHTQPCVQLAKAPELMFLISEQGGHPGCKWGSACAGTPKGFCINKP